MGTMRSCKVIKLFPLIEPFFQINVIFVLHYRVGDGHFAKHKTKIMGCQNNGTFWQYSRILRPD